MELFSTSHTHHCIKHRELPRSQCSNHYTSRTESSEAQLVEEARVIEELAKAARGEAKTIPNSRHRCGTSSTWESGAAACLLRGLCQLRGTDDFDEECGAAAEALTGLPLRASDRSRCRTGGD